MSRKTDLEQSIREAYRTMEAYRHVIRLSDWTQEKLRAKRGMEEQWRRVEGYLQEYRALAGGDVPDDIARVASSARSWQADLERLCAPALSGSWEEREAYRSRQRIIERVRNDWIAGVLDRSLYSVARIELGLAERPEAVERLPTLAAREPGGRVRELPGVPGQPAEGARMSEVFDLLGGALLILGAPGTGKTTLLLELANDLLDRAEKDPDHLIPVVFSLSSWGARRQPLADWMVGELNRRYDVPGQTARTWVDREMILPLLDGLDEVTPEHRAACVEAINQFYRDHRLVPLVVCSRTADYEALAARLRLQDAIVLQPLTPAQVDRYLEQAGAPLAEVREALRRDETLYALLDTPLMVSIVALAIMGRSPAVLREPGRLEERRARLLAAYTDAMYERSAKEAPFPRQKTERWLAWLAAQMTAHDVSVFYLERMQVNWLPTRGQQRVVRWGTGILSGLSVGLIAGAALGLAVGPLAGLAVTLFFGLAFGLIYGLGGRSRITQPVETVRWSWPRAMRWGAFGLLLGLAGELLGGLAADGVGEPFGWLVGVLVFGLFVGLVYGLGLYSRFVRRVETSWSCRRALSGLVFGLVIAVFLGLLTQWIGGRVGGPAGRVVRMIVVGLIVGLLYALSGGLMRGEIATRVSPNEGMRRSAWHALGFGLAGALAYGLVALGFALLLRSLFDLALGGITVLFGVLVLGVIGGLRTGLYNGGYACLQHVGLRALLWRNDCMPRPRSTVPFLDDAAERMVLRKVGGGYIFVHRLLQDYYAGLWERGHGGAG
jgi:hypothetical protein